MNKKLIIGVCVVVVIVIVAIATIIPITKKSDYDERCKDRAEKCLKIYDDPKNPYPVIKQTPIPNGGKYYNNLFKKEKYYGLRDFFYASSYKSYLPCGYTNDVVSYNAIKNVLLKGARAIHLDIFFKGDDPFCENSSIIVANVIDGQLSYSDCVKENERYLDFMNCLQLINEIAWSKTDAPLFL